VWSVRRVNNIISRRVYSAVKYMIHPNSRGYKLLANQYIKAINTLIENDEFFGIRETRTEYTLP